MDFKAIFAHFSKAVLLPGFVVFGLFIAAPVNAQETTTTPTKDARTELKSSLTDLSSLYQKEVDRLEKQQQQSKGLYDDGLISRVDFENGEKALADARAKVEQVTKEIAAANQPMPEIGILSDPTATSAAVWSTGNARVDNLINFYGKQYGVDPFLIYCTMSQESGFTSGATSPKGAMGLMQLMPATAARYGVTNPYDVGQSIMGGTRYLKDLLKMFNGRVDLALAGYNAGEGAVMKFGNNIPPYEETRNYVKLILKRYAVKKPTS
ncbi:MAG TPA: lytic transglycosylase domain-containing protein [Pyrinomonadaceae bacterium]|nr:lytic transglycosylase domain-containing protein [Pyrinomonadaceae bacterium]